MSKRVLIFSTFYYPKFVGGAEVAVKEITDRVTPDEMVFDMITLRVDKKLPQSEKLGNINIFRIGPAFSEASIFYNLNFKFSKFLFPYLGYFKALSLHKYNTYSIVWSIMAGYAGFAGSFFKKKHPEVPFILTLQEGTPLEEIERKVRFFRKIFKNIFLRADKVQSISKFLGEWARSLGFEKKLVVVPNGVDVKAFSHEFSSDELREYEERIRKTETSFFLITASRLVTKNAIDVMIRSLEYLPDFVKLVVLGTGPEEGGLIKLKEKLNLQSRVLFLGFVSHLELPKYLQSANVFVRPSRTEGLGNSFLEAMAAGLPVIATAVGGIPDFLKDHENGLFVNVDDPKDLANKVLALIQNPSLKDKLVENARRMVEGDYDWQKIAERMKKEVLAF